MKAGCDIQRATQPPPLPGYQGAVHTYVKAQRDGNTLYIGDHVGQDAVAKTVRGKVGAKGKG